MLIYYAINTKKSIIFINFHNFFTIGLIVKVNFITYYPSIEPDH